MKILLISINSYQEIQHSKIWFQWGSETSAKNPGYLKTFLQFFPLGIIIYDTSFSFTNCMNFKKIFFSFSSKLGPLIHPFDACVRNPSGKMKGSLCVHM